MRRRRLGDARRRAPDRRLPLAAPDHEPRPHRVRRAPDARRARPTTRAATRSGRYLEDYAERFGLRERIRLGDGVADARARADGGWEVELDDGRRERFDVLVVANGHNEEAKWPEPAVPGRRSPASQLHALDYDEADDFAGQRVLVVGHGQQRDGHRHRPLARRRAHLLSARHGTWVIPKRLLGKPADQIIKPWVAVHVPVADPPAAVADAAPADRRPARALRPARAEPAACSRPTRRSPTRVLSRISHGEITPEAGHRRRSRRARVAFTDGSARGRSTRSSGARATASRCPFLDQALIGPGPEGAAALQAHLPPRLPGPLLRRADAVDRARRSRSSSASRSSSPSTWPASWAPPPPRSSARDCERRRRYALARWGEHGRPDDARRLRPLHARARARARARASAGARRERRARSSPARAAPSAPRCATELRGAAGRSPGST